MGCDIHLRVERRRKVNPFPNYRHEWYNVGFKGEFGVRIYGMFARMAGIMGDYTNKVEFKPRGLPEDMTDRATCESFYMNVTSEEAAIKWGRKYCSKESAERWVEQGYSEWVDEAHTRVTDPDLHSHSWLTTQELRLCFDDCFKQEDGTMHPFADYVEWLGLVSLCEGIESTGEYECRVVFAFDN